MLLLGEMLRTYVSRAKNKSLRMCRVIRHVVYTRASNSTEAMEA